MYKFIIKPILFLFDPEKVHNFTMGFLSKAKLFYPLFKILYNPGKSEEITIAGLRFRNRLGLAAGLDKNGIAIRFWNVIGFGHIEVGTVTPLPQPGNDKPRIFRLKEDKALINRLGFNNQGAEKIRENIKEAKKYLKDDFIIGVNIGKNKLTPIENAKDDYLECMNVLYDVADYFTINISSPNTEKLRELQKEEHLDELLQELSLLNINLSKNYQVTPKSIFLKIAPDLEDEGVEDIFRLAVKSNLTGIIATNTTISREGLIRDINETGGLSGNPLKSRAIHVLKKLNELNLQTENHKMVLIGVGGVFENEDYYEKINSGAQLVQIYTGFIYEGPGILKKLLQ
jgi:dihydroorotate dehydrogenase